MEDYKPGAGSLGQRFRTFILPQCEGRAGRQDGRQWLPGRGMQNREPEPLGAPGM